MRYLSLFSGIEAATQAWHQLGWQCVGFSEIEPAPCAVLAQRYPHVPNLGDVTRIGLCARYDPVRILAIAAKYAGSRLAKYYVQLATRMESLGPIDLMVFGSPCQDLSVAGKRKGFNYDGRLTRSGLFHLAMDIARWARQRHGLRFALWENVPGAFTSNQGRDFAAVVDQMAGMEGTAVPPKGWGTEGCAVGPEAMVEWSTLDAQWFGVAQRRRRCFAIADFGDWSGRPPILLEPEGVRGDSPPRRKARQDTAAGTLSSTDGGCDVDHAMAGHLRIAAFGGNNQSGPIDVATARNACGSGSGSGRLDFESETFLVQEVCGTLDANYGKLQGASGQDACHGHSHLIPLVFDTTNITSATNRSNPKPGDACHTLAGTAHPPAIAFDSRQDCVSSMEVFGALGSSSQQAQAVTMAMEVRRLVPRECERLQGMADDHTLVTFRGKPMADGPRYKAIGNSMAVVVMLWIGRQIDKALIREFFTA